MMNIFKTIVRITSNFLDNSSGYTIFLDDTHEMAKEFASKKLVNDIQSRQVVTNEEGKEICLATFRTIAVEGIKTRREALSICISLKAENKDGNYFMS